MTQATAEAPKLTLHDVIDHLVSVAPLDEATRILFHHSIADTRDDSEPVEGARARVDVTAAQPITQAYDDEALKAVQAENADLKAKLADQAASIDDLRRLVELALNRDNAKPATAAVAPPESAPDAAVAPATPVAPTVGESNSVTPTAGSESN